MVGRIITLGIGAAASIAVVPPLISGPEGTGPGTGVPNHSTSLQPQSHSYPVRKVNPRVCHGRGQVQLALVQGDTVSAVCTDGTVLEVPR